MRNFEEKTKFDNKCFGLFTCRESFESLPIIEGRADLYEEWYFQHLLPEKEEVIVSQPFELSDRSQLRLWMADWLSPVPYEVYDPLLDCCGWFPVLRSRYTPEKFLLRKKLLARIVLQSGESHADRRVRREEYQRATAAKKAEEVRKSVPKRMRLDRVKVQRDKRLDLQDIELQAGFGLRTGLAVGVGGFMLAQAGVRGVCKLSKNIGSAFGAIGRVSDAVYEHIDTVGVSGYLGDLSAIFKQFKDALEDFVKKMKKLLRNLWILPVALILCVLFGKWRACALSGLLLSFLPGFFGHLWPHIAAFFPIGRVENQSGMSNLASLLSVCFTFSVFKGKITPIKVTEFVKRIATLKRQGEGWETLISWMMKAIETLVNFLRSKVGKESIQVFESGDRIVMAWARRVEAVLAADATGATMDPVKLDSIIKLLQEGYGFKELYRFTEVGKLVDVLIARLGSTLVPYHGSITARNNFRFEPVATFLYGQAGVGKTILAVPLVSAILLASGLISSPATSDQVVAQMWQKGTSEYWQGYNGQTAMIMDDAFQNRAFQGDKDNDYFNLIKMVGSFSMPLNFADVASKGKIFFDSKIIYASTNLSSFLSEAKVVIHEPEAVARRITYGLELFVSPDFTDSKGHLDYQKFLQERVACAKRFNDNPGSDPLCYFPWYIWQVAKHDFMTGVTVRDRVNLRDQIQEIVDCIKGRLSSHTLSSEFLTDFVGAFSSAVPKTCSPVYDLQAGIIPDVVCSDIGDVTSQHLVLDSGRSVPFLMCEFLRKDRESRKEESRHINLFLARFLPIMGNAAKWFVIVTAVKALAIMLETVFKSVFPKKKFDVQSNTPASKRKVASKTPVRLQSDVPYTPAEHAYCNSYKMYVERTGLVFGQVTFLSGTLAMQPQHFTELVRIGVSEGSLEPDDILTFRSSISSSVSVGFSIAKYLSFARISERDIDVEFVRFETIRAHSDITKIFVHENELRFIGSKAGNLHLLEVDDSTKIHEKNRYMKFGFPWIKVDRNLTGLPNGRSMNRYASYIAGTNSGDCGALLTITDAKSFNNRVLLGFHVANLQGTSKGFSAIVTYEMVVAAQFKLKVIRDSFEADLSLRGVVMQCGSDLPPSHCGSFLPIGTLSKPVTICPVSRFFRTNLYGSLGPFALKPAPLSPVLRDGVRVYPMERAVANYSTGVLHHELPWLADAVHIATIPFCEATMHVKRQLYSFDEAIKGIPEEKFRSIPRNTAAGFPYVYDVKGGKREFFGDEMEYDLTGPQALDLCVRVDRILECARGGERLSHVFIDFLKDELRSEKKVEAVATRLISSAPLDYVVAFRMLFGAFTSAMMRNNVTTGLAPGICTYADWPRVVRHVTRVGTSVFDGDFTAFDSSEQPCVHEAILVFINRWYGDSEENQLARGVLWLELIHSRHVGGVGSDQRYIYQWNKSLPSGHPFTTVVNSLYSLVTLVGCYIHLTNDRLHFWDNVSPLTYGDDNIVNVSDAIKDVYNQVTVSGAMAKCFGLKYTSGAKDGVLAPYTTIEHITFLKRRFLCDPRGWLCPLELESFLYTHYWCKNKALVNEIVLDSLENALEELALHPIEVWNEYAPKVAGIIADHYNRVTRVRLDRDAYLSLVLSRVDDWY